MNPSEHFGKGAFCYGNRNFCAFRHLQPGSPPRWTGVTVNITGDGFTAVRTTDAEGNAADVVITAPDCALSLEAENTTRRPYAVCSLTAAKTGFRPVRIQGIQIFAGQVTLAQRR